MQHGSRKYFENLYILVTHVLRITFFICHSLEAFLFQIMHHSTRNSMTTNLDCMTFLLLMAVQGAAPTAILPPVWGDQGLHPTDETDDDP